MHSSRCSYVQDEYCQAHIKSFFCLLQVGHKNNVHFHVHVLFCTCALKASTAKINTFPTIIYLFILIKLFFCFRHEIVNFTNQHPSYVEYLWACFFALLLQLSLTRHCMQHAAVCVCRTASLLRIFRI